MNEQIICKIDMSVAAVDYYTHSECSCLGVRCLRSELLEVEVLR